MSTVDELRARKAQLPELCQTRWWPLVDQFEADFKVDRSEVRALGRRAFFHCLFIWAGFTFALPHVTPAKYADYVRTIEFAAYVVALFRFVGEMFVVGGLVVKRQKALAILRGKIRAETLKHIFPELNLRYPSVFPTDLYRSCGLFKAQYDRSMALCDYDGVLGQTKFNIKQIKTENRVESRDSRGETVVRYDLIFKGLIFQADFNKNFRGHTVVADDKLESKLGFVGRTLQKLATSDGKRKLVELENPIFESHFKITSTDPTEARYLLTPEFMELILKVKEWHIWDIQIAFMNNNLIMVIPYANDFLSSDFAINDLTLSVEGLADELIKIVSIVEMLNLNQRIWNKQSVGA